jgi:hypothetical protein
LQLGDARTPPSHQPWHACQQGGYERPGREWCPRLFVPPTYNPRCRAPLRQDSLTDIERPSYRFLAWVAALVCLSVGALALTAWTLSALAALLFDITLILPTLFSASALAAIAVGLALLVVADDGNSSAGTGHRPRLEALRIWLAGSVGAGPARLPRWEAALLVAILVVFALVVMRLISMGAVLGWDESVYALKARSWLLSTPTTGWGLHRSPGLPALGTVPILLDGSEVSLRLIGLIGGIGILVAAWWVARSIGGPPAGVLTALTLAGVPDLQLQSSLFLADVPAAAVLLLLTAFVWSRCELRRLDWRFALAAALAAGAFYLRFASALPVLLLALASLVIWWRPLVANRTLILTTVGLGLVLLLPHFFESTLRTGTPWGIVLLSYEIAIPPVSAAHTSTSLVATARQLMSRFTYWPTAGLAIAGIGSWVWIALRGERNARKWRAATFLLVPALGQILVTGTSFHTEFRFYLFPIALLVATGSMAAMAWWSAITIRWRTPVALFVVVAGLFVILRGGVANVAAQTAAKPSDVIRAAAEAIRQDASGSCSVVTYLVPEMTWYTGCATYPFGDSGSAADSTLPGDHRYMLIVAGHPDQQPQGEALASYLSAAEPTPVATIRGPAGDLLATIYKFP